MDFQNEGRNIVGAVRCRAWDHCEETRARMRD